MWIEFCHLKLIRGAVLRIRSGSQTSSASAKIWERDQQGGAAHLERRDHPPTSYSRPLTQFFFLSYAAMDIPRPYDDIIFIAP